MPKRLKFLLTAEIEKINCNTGTLDLADIQTDRGGDLGQFHSLVVRAELGFDLFQERRFAGIVQADDEHKIFVFLKQKSPESIDQREHFWTSKRELNERNDEIGR